MNKIIVFLLMMITILSCDPQSEKDVTLGPLPGSPDFTVVFVPNDSNRVVVTDVSSDNFSRLWITGGNCSQILFTFLKKENIALH